MALLQWVPELDTGIAEIDTQHKRIVDYINKLHELRQTHHREGLAEVIAQLLVKDSPSEGKPLSDI